MKYYLINYYKNLQTELSLRNPLYMTNYFLYVYFGQLKDNFNINKKKEDNKIIEDLIKMSYDNFCSQSLFS